MGVSTWMGNVMLLRRHGANLPVREVISCYEIRNHSWMRCALGA